MRTHKLVVELNLEDNDPTDPVEWPWAMLVGLDVNQIKVSPLENDEDS